jgi:CyaY protein
MTLLNETDYDALALPELKSLVKAFDALDTDGIEAELASDILTLEFNDGTRYVLNSHRAARQIWMAADRSAWHFDWDSEKQRWFASKTSDELWATVQRVVQAKLGRPIQLR